MIDQKQMLKSYEIDYSALLEFKPKGGVRLLSAEEYEIEKDWLKNYQLGFEIIPIFTNDESDSVGVYANGFLKGKVVLMNHDSLDFTPRFGSLESFIKQINGIENEDFYDWHDLPESAFDYPLKDDIGENALLNCWELINQDKFESEDNRELIIKTAMYLTPPEKLDTIVVFLKDKGTRIVDAASWLLGIFHKYEPARAVIASLVESRYKDHYWRKDFYNGEFEKKGFWKKMFGK